MSSESKSPIRVLITGSAGQIGYSLIPLVAGGKIWGENQPVILHLLDIPPAQKALQGVCMEIEDCAYPLVHGIVATTELKEACAGVNVAILVGGIPRGKDMTRGDLLGKNSPIFIGQGKALSEYADKNCKVLVVANPANSNAYVAMMNASNIPKENFTCLTRLDQNRAVGQLALKLKTTPGNVKNAIIWGNHSSTMYPDASIATANGQKVSEQVDEAYLSGEWSKTVQERGAAVIAARGLSSAMSAANAVADHLRDWLVGTKEGEIVSMGVCSDGSYGVTEGLIYSFPVTCKAGAWTIVQGLTLSDAAKAALKATEQELLNEKAALPQNAIPSQ